MTTEFCVIAGAYPGRASLEVLAMWAFSTALIVAELLLLVRTLRPSPAVRVIAMTFGVVGAIGGFLLVPLFQGRLASGVLHMMIGAALAVTGVGFLRWCVQSRLRTLVLLTILASIGATWFGVASYRVSRQRNAVKVIENLGGTIHRAESSVPAWLRSPLGEDWFCTVADIRASGTRLSDAGLERLQGLPELQLLRADGTQVTDAGLEHVKQMPQLRLLWLSDTQITDVGMEHLERMAKLEELRLNGTQVTDAGLAHIKGLTELRILFLEKTQVTDSGAASLKGLTNLLRLSLSGTRVTDAGLGCVTGLPRLGWLSLDDTLVTVAGLKHLGGLTQLQELSLSGTQVADAGLIHLTGLERLENLRLDRTQVTDAGLVHLSRLTQLKWLSLCGTKVTDTGLDHLAGLSQLRWLRLSGTQVTPAGAQKFQERVPTCGIERMDKWAEGDGDDVDIRGHKQFQQSNADLFTPPRPIERVDRSCLLEGVATVDDIEKGLLDSACAKLLHRWLDETPVVTWIDLIDGSPDKRQEQLLVNRLHTLQGDKYEVFPLFILRAGK